MAIIVHFSHANAMVFWTHPKTDDSLITRTFFGFDFWSKDPAFWHRIYQMMGKESVNFGLIG